MTRTLVSAAALCLCFASATAAAIPIQECRAKYKAASAEGAIHSSWADFQVKQCGLPPPTRKPKSAR